MTPRDLLIVPYYGRDYTTTTQVREAWEDNKDFILMFSGQTISKSCCPPNTEVWARYNSRRDKFLLVEGK